MLYSWQWMGNYSQYYILEALHAQFANKEGTLTKQKLTNWTAKQT